MKTIKSSTAWITIAAAAVILFGGAITWYYSQFPADLSGGDFSGTPIKQDLTKDWQAYENKDYGFSFKYPKDWSLQDDKKGDIYLFDTKKVYQSEGSDLAPITVQYYPDTSGASIDTYLSGTRSALKSILKKETTTIGGRAAYILQGTLEPVSHDSRIIFANENVISFSSNGTELSGQDRDGAIGSTFRLILSTVQFTDLTANWKTFELAPLKLSFKHPPEWGSASSNNGKTKVDTGYSYMITFSENSSISMGYASTDMSAGREGTLYEMININQDVSKINSCSTYKQYIGSDYVTSCENVSKGGKAIGILVILDFPDDAMTPGSYTAAYYFTGNQTMPVVGISADNKQATTQSIFSRILSSFTAI